MDKLNLPTHNHPQPYSLTSLKKMNKISVDKRCLVEFSIGDELREQVWCDIPPINTFHIMLDQHWQNDRKTVHDGYQNTYTFIKNDKHIIFLPWKEPEEMSNLRQGQSCTYYLFVDHEGSTSKVIIDGVSRK